MKKNSKSKKVIQERWRPVVGFEGLYEVSNLGRVRSVDRVVPVVMTRSGKTYKEKRVYSGKVLSYVYPGRGMDYPYVHLNDTHHNRYTIQVKKIVADTFMGGYNLTKHIHNIDGNPDNCTLYNLAVDDI